MRRYSEAVKADVRRRMSPPIWQSVAQISAELGIHVVTLYNWRMAWRLQGEVVPASEKDPDGWSAADKFTVVLETAGLNATELSAYCRERACSPSRWNVGGRQRRMLMRSRAHFERAERAGKAPCPGPAGDRGPATRNASSSSLNLTVLRKLTLRGTGKLNHASRPRTYIELRPPLLKCSAGGQNGPSG